MPRFSKDDWEALNPLLDEALELPAEARAAWLARHRVSHPTVAAEIEVLLDQEAATDFDEFLGPDQAPLAPAVSSLTGQVLGAYILERPLGQGGMGSVWLARRNDGRFEGNAAIKFLSLAVAGPAGEARFRREGSVLARLTHPNIARLLDAGVTPEGQPYLVLEYVDGQPIDTWCDEHRLSVEDRLRLFLDVLSSVANAHANLIVHRDIKPANIMVTAQGTVKLLDFGIAKLLDENGRARTALTGTHEAVLTFEYAAPEQLRGEPVSTAIDVYSLGVVLYELLSGQHPTNDRCHTPAEHVRAILDTDPRQLSRAVTPSALHTVAEVRQRAESRGTSPEKLSRLYVGDLDNILSRALRKDPAERYPTVQALADDIFHYLRHEPVSARGDSWTYRAGRFVRRYRGGVTAAALVTLALISAATVTTFQAREATRQRDAAVYESKRADAQIEFQHLLMSEVGDQPMSMRELLDRGRGLLEHQYSGDPPFLNSILLQLASQYGELGDSKSQSELLVRAESLALAGHGAERLAEIRCNQADNLRSQGEYAMARTRLASADSLLAANPDPETESLCLQIKSVIEDESGEADSSVAAARRAIAIRNSLGRTDDLQYLNLLNTLAGALSSENRYREARTIYQQALKGMDRSGRGGMMSRVIMQHDMAIALQSLGETAEAETLFHDALVHATTGVSGGQAPSQPLIHYAETALFQAHADSARKYFALLVDQAVRTRQSYWEGRGLYGLARSEIALGQLREAEQSAIRLGQIMVLNPQVRRSTDDVIPDTLTLQGLLARARGDTATAYLRFTQSLKGTGYYEGKSKRRQRPVVILAAETGLSLGKTAEALRLARDIAEATAMDSLSYLRSAYPGEARVVAGRALLAMGDTASARLVLDSAVTALRIGAGEAHPRTMEAERLLAGLTRETARKKAGIN
jgi:serine/threonine-protein kinase